MMLEVSYYSVDGNKAVPYKFILLTQLDVKDKTKSKFHCCFHNTSSSVLLSGHNSSL